MSRVTNQNWITFGGEPVTGRTPPSVIVYGPELSKEQSGAVAHAYKLFTDVCSVSLAKYQVQNRTFADGTKLRMTSNNGVDQVRVWTSGGSAIELAYLFWGVPVNDLTLYEGIYDLGPSAKWIIERAKELPKKLRPVGPLEPRNGKTGHPGHITWVSPHFKLYGQEIVVSWKGPRNRYARIRPHPDYSDMPVLPPILPASEYIFKNSQYVWINGQRVNTGVENIVAACLHRPDPDKPQEVVLRVCTNKANPEFSSGATPIYKVAVYDLVASRGAQSSSLQGLLSAVHLFVKATYEADEANAITPLWTFAQRPHFNNKGDKIASIIRAATGVLKTSIINGVFQPTDNSGSIGAIFNPETWAFLQRITASSNTNLSSSEVGGVTREPTPPGSTVLGKILSATYTESISSFRVEDSLIAVDFLNDSVAYIYHQRIETRVGSTNGSASDLSGSEIIDSTTNTAFRIIHSVHGELSNTSTFNFSRQSVTDDGPWVFSYSAEFHALFVVVGDISRDIIAVGSSNNLKRNAYTVAYSSNLPQTSVQFYSVSMLFDVWADGVQVVTQTSGSFANIPIITSTFNFGGSMPGVTPTSYAMFTGGGYGVGSFSFSSSSSSEEFGLGSFEPSHYGHIAISTTRNIVYIGAAQNYNRGSMSGLEICLFKEKDQYVQKPVPAYAGGTDPTIIAPVFTGLAYKEAPP